MSMTCLNCSEIFRQRVTSIEICDPCVEIHTSDLWGMHGVPTE